MRPIAFWGLLPALGAALLGQQLASPLGWWALLAAYVFLGLLQSAMLSWVFFWHARDEAVATRR
jgi:hypothetical protein